MALSGVHLVFGQCDFDTVANTPLIGQPAQATLLGKALASQTMSGAGTSTISAVAPTNGSKLPVCSIMASAAIFYAVGKNPDATSGTRRYFDPSFGPLDFYCDVGDFFAWIAA